MTRYPLIVAVLLIAACGNAPSSQDSEPFELLDLDDATARPAPAWEATRATVRVHYPLGTSVVKLRTAAPGPDIPCVPETARNSCTAEVTQFPTGEKTLVFRPVLDDVAARGPRYLVERKESIDVYPHFKETAGSLRVLVPAFHSEALQAIEPDNQRVIYAYLPASYVENTTQRYPVVYMHDGRNLFDAATSITGIEWQVDESADAAWEQTGAFDELIVIGIDQLVTVGGQLQNRRRAEYNPTPTDLGVSPPSATEYAQMVATELKPMVDAMLRTRPEREHTFTAGSSLGAAVSVWIALKHPTVFGGFAALSMAGGVFDNNWVARAVAAESDVRPGARLERLYLDLGTMEGVESVSPFLSVYRALGYRDGIELESLYELNGQHDEYAWARRLPTALGSLVPARRLP